MIRGTEKRKIFTTGEKMGSIFLVISTNSPNPAARKLVDHLAHHCPYTVTWHTLKKVTNSALPPDLKLIILAQSNKYEEGQELLKQVKLNDNLNLIPCLVLNKTGQIPNRVKGIWIEADRYFKGSESIARVTRCAEVLVSDMIHEQEDTGLRKKICFLVQNELKHLFEVNNIISTQLAQTGLEDDEIVNLRLTLDELGTNAIRHGNANDPRKKVIIHCKIFENKLWVTIEDEGQGFNANQIPDPTATERIL